MRRSGQVREKPQNHSKLLRREKRNHDKKNGLKERVVQQVTVATIAPTDVTTQGRKRKEKIRMKRTRRGEKKRNGRNAKRRKRVNDVGREKRKRLLSREVRKILP